MMTMQDKDELRRAIANKVPAKIDIGPVYNVDPQRRKAYSGDTSYSIYYVPAYANSKAAMLQSL